MGIFQTWKHYRTKISGLAAGVGAVAGIYGFHLSQGCGGAAGRLAQAASQEYQSSCATGSTLEQVGFSILLLGVSSVYYYRKHE